MTARWSDPHRLPVRPTGYVRAVISPVGGPVSGIELVLAFLAGDRQVGDHNCGKGSSGSAQVWSGREE